MMQKHRTTCFSDVLVDYPGSLHAEPEWKGGVVGFRLANDGETEICRGEPWFEVPAEPIRCEDVPSTRSYCTGFRLVFNSDKEDECQTT